MTAGHQSDFELSLSMFNTRATGSVDKAGLNGLTAGVGLLVPAARTKLSCNVPEASCAAQPLTALPLAILPRHATIPS
jgi:hypothetical protein